MTVSAQLPSDTPKYQLLMEIGRGGMGVVYLAMARGPRGFVKLVVLKTLQPQLVDNDGACRMFLDEARILARLAHPNIVQVFEVIQHLGLPAMVMEYMEGRPLSAVLDPDPVPLPRVMYLYAICKVLAGLHAAHELRDYDGRALNLIHRDVSPHNVFLMFSGQVKVLDFGIAKLADSNGETQTGELKGKIRYMAPEQIGGDRLDRRVDIFAAGIMLWEALAGARLWSDLSETEVLRRLINGEIPPLPERDDIPASFAKLCEKALAFDPNRRFATASEFQRELEGHLGELPEVGKEESLSAFMLEHFGRERDATNRVIETQIKVAQRHETNGPPGYEPPSVGNMANGKPTMGKIPRLLWFSAIVAVTVVALGIFSAANRPLLSETPERPGTEKPTEPRTGARAAMTCQAGFKACAGACVSIDRPDVGCNADECTPCGVSNATPRCNLHHECDIAVCYQDHANCDGDPRDGCETEIRTDPDNCGACGHKCASLSHAQRGCGDVCTIWRCEKGFRDCNGIITDGCEVNVLDDARHCGRCETACGPAQRCKHGSCVP